MTMNEVMPGLWIGDLPSAKDDENLRANNIHSILSAMRGRVTIDETFIRHQINLDDTEDADILVHFLPSIAFIEAELEKGRGVLVHCVAGTSRSATIVAAFLMYRLKIDPEAALNKIREARPTIQPNDGFMTQLYVFHEASHRISRRDKATRMFYLERAVEEVMNGEGGYDTDMFAKFPLTPSDTLPSTPVAPRRRIRCKMCRQELAAREHMLDHGQLGPATPAMLSAAPSRRASSSVGTEHGGAPLVRRPSGDTRPRRPSNLGPRGLSDSLFMSSMSAVQPDSAVADSDEDDDSPGSAPTATAATSLSSRRSSGSRHGSRNRRPSNLTMSKMADLTMTQAESAVADSDEEDSPPAPPQPSKMRRSSSSRSSRNRRPSNLAMTKASDMFALSSIGPPEGVPITPPRENPPVATSPSAVDLPPTIHEGVPQEQLPVLPEPSELHIERAMLLGRRLSNTLGSTSRNSSVSSPQPDRLGASTTFPSMERTSSPGHIVSPTSPSAGSGPAVTHIPPPPQGSYISPADLAAQLSSNPKLAALRGGVVKSPEGGSGAATQKQPTWPISPPILINPKCSGYFVEPMKWMEPFLESGQLAGKINCPNPKCGAKLGNYDWAGVCCGCKEWVTPGFCINRSKVDEFI